MKVFEDLEDRVMERERTRKVKQDTHKLNTAVTKKFDQFFTKQNVDED